MLRHCLHLGAISLLLVLPGWVSAQTVMVNGPSELGDALSTAPAGSTIVLAPGEYGDFRLTGDIDAEFIRSADADNPARFSSFDVRDVADLTFENLLFDYTYASGDRATLRPFMWRDSSNLTLRGNVFDGDVAQGLSETDNGFGFGFALVVWDSRDVLLEGNEIFNFFKGIHVRNVEDAVVRLNDISQIRSDGMNFVQVARVLIEENHIHNFNRSLESGDHSDMIQFWTARTDWPSHDVIIRGNVLNSGDGWFTQSIFLRNERSDRIGSTDPALFYRNITIEDNVILNAHLHGITVGDAIYLTVRHNTVVQNPASAEGDPSSGLYIPSIRIAEVNRNVEVTGNVAALIVGHHGQSGWLVEDNLEVQNQLATEPGFYEDVFIGGELNRPNSFRYRPNGPAGLLGLGAPMLRYRTLATTTFPRSQPLIKEPSRR